MSFIIMNSVRLNQAADLMWKWEQSGRTDKALHEEASKSIADHCELYDAPSWLALMLLDAMQITVRIANGFPPNDGVGPERDDPDPAAAAPE
jgi:hypothetical protein